MNFTYIKNTAVNTANGPLQLLRLITEIKPNELDQLLPTDVISAEALTPLLVAGDNSPLLALITSLLNNKKDKEGSKVLSTNDYTTAEKTKLAGIADNANNVTVVDSFASTSTTTALSSSKGKQLNDLIAALTTRIVALEAKP